MAVCPPCQRGRCDRCYDGSEHAEATAAMDPWGRSLWWGCQCYHSSRFSNRRTG